MRATLAAASLRLRASPRVRRLGVPLRALHTSGATWRSERGLPRDFIRSDGPVRRQVRPPLNFAPAAQARGEKVVDGGLPGDRNRRQTRDGDKMQKVMERMHAEWRTQNAEFQRSWDKIAQKIDVDVSKDLHATQMTLKENVFRPGDFVQVRERIGMYLMGVVVPAPPDAQGASDTIFVLGISGMVHMQQREDVLVHFPGMLDAKTCARAGPTSYTHVSGGEAMFEAAGVGAGPLIQEGDEPLDVERFRARAGLITVLRIFRQRVHQGTLLLQNAFLELYGSRALMATKAHTEGVEADAYEPLAQRRVTVHEAARKMLAHLAFGPEADVSRSLYVATHQLFFHVPEIYAIDGNTYRTSQAYTARPLSDTAVIQQVTEWTRGIEGGQSQSEGSLIVMRFVDRVKQVQVWRQDHAEELAAQQAQLKRGEMRAVTVPGVQWTKEDHTIFRFLTLLLLQGRYLQSDVVTGPAMAIVKLILGPMPFVPLPFDAPSLPRSATHSYPIVPHTVSHGSPTFAAAVTRWLLEQVGAVAPWQSLVSELHDLPSEADVVAQVRAEINGTAEKSKQTQQHLVPLDDASNRKRFTHPVYVIDDADARELDDGISLVPVSNADGSPSSDVWLHMHIADPTAYFRPDSVLGHAAAEQSSTLYYPDGSFPLLPEELFETQPGLALSSGEPQRAMTFSVRLTPEGTAVDYDVSLTLLEDVRVRHYDDTDAFLSLAPSEVEQHKKDEWALLTRARTYLYQVQKRRWANHAFLNPSAAVPVVHTPDMPLPAPRSSSPTVFLGAPEVSIRANDRASTPEEQAAGYPLEPATAAEWSVRDVVAEAMLLAGRVAGKWGADRGLALPYNGLEPPDQARLVDLLQAYPSRHGAMTRRLVLQLNTQTTYTTPRPVLQTALGLEPLPFLPPGGPADALSGSGYVRVTSPMRRYADMVAHWQIRHVLEGRAARSAAEPSAAEPEPQPQRPPWTRAEMAALCPRLDASMRRVKALSKAGVSFWSAYYLQAVLRRGAPDPQLARTSEAAKDQAGVLLPREAWVISDHVRVDPDVFANTRVHIRGLGIAAEARLPIDLMSQGHDRPDAQLSADLLAGRYSLTDIVRQYPHVPDISLGRDVSVRLVDAVCTGPTNWFMADILPLPAPPDRASSS